MIISSPRTISSQRRMLLGAALALTLNGPALAQGGDLETIRKRGKIRVGIGIDWPPYASADTRNRPDGYDADVARLLASDLGLELEYVILTGPNRIPFLLTDKVDVVVASLAITPERAKQVAFSRPYSSASLVLLGPAGVDIRSPEDFPKYRIGVPRASTPDIVISKVAPEGTRLHRFDDDASTLQAMLAGQIDSASTSSVIAAQTRKRFPGKYTVQYVVNEQVMGIAMQKERTRLLAAVDEFIARNLANGTLNAMFEKRIGTALPDSVLNPKN